MRVPVTGSIDELLRTVLEYSLTMERELPWQSLAPQKIAVTGFNWFAANALAEFYDARLPTEVEWKLRLDHCLHRCV